MNARAERAALGEWTAQRRCPAPGRVSRGRWGWRGLAGVLLAGALMGCEPTSGKDEDFTPQPTTNGDFSVSYVDTGVRPVYLAVADIDGDGSLDAATADRFGDTVTLHTGGLATRTTIGVGSEPTDVVIGDLDDVPATLDLAVLNGGGTILTVLLADGAGGWTETDFDLFALSTQVSLVDLNLDGSAAQDIVVSVTLADEVWALVNDGTGAFTPVVTPTLQNPQKFVWDDWNGDGLLDLVVLHPSEDRISVLLGDGAGGFAASPADGIAAKDNPSHMVAEDLDGDGDRDLAISNFTAGTISSMRANSSGGFSTFDTATVPASPGAIVAGAFTGAAGGLANDLAVVHRGRAEVSTLIWDGNAGSYDLTVEIVTADPTDIVVGDFNADGLSDVATTEQDFRALSVLAGDGEGNFTRTGIGFLSEPSFPLVVDLDANGIDDLLLLQSKSNRIVVLENLH